jgi:serine/threonine protein kinase
MLAEEALVLEYLKPHPHRNLVRFHGYISARGRIVDRALEKYNIILQYRFEDDRRALDAEAGMLELRAHVYHLYPSSYAHNALNPMNVAINQDDQPVILDFGSCRKFGKTLLSGWNAGVDLDEDFSTPAAHQSLVR